MGNFLDFQEGQVFDKELLQHTCKLYREPGCLRELVLFMSDMVSHRYYRVPPLATSSGRLDGLNITGRSS